MSRPAARKDLSLKGLELFQICANKGSLQAVAQETGLSVSTVSHHLRALEDHLGVELFNHARRPMVLNPRGRVFLRGIDDALQSIRKAKAEARAGNIAETSHLRMATIEDFVTDIVPELAVYLSENMPHCDFLFHTDTSHAIIDMLRDRQFDLGVTTSPPERLRDLQERPLLRDPFVVVLPRMSEQSLSEVVEGRTRLPFLRFAGNQIIARQIESQLRRLGVKAPHRFECSNNQTLMAMVAAGAGWTITTPLLFSRARQFHDRVRMHQFPGKAFARTLAIVSTPDCSRSVLDLVEKKLRALINAHAIAPAHRDIPWLQESFVLVD